MSRYLRLATRGVYGRQRRAIQDELRGHIEARTAELLLGGLGELEATREALRELGAPASIAGGMAQVYSLPPVLRGAVGLALAATALLSLAPHGLAQVQVFDKNVPDLPTSPPYLKVDSLLHELRLAGTRATIDPQGLDLSFTGQTDIHIPVEVGHHANYGEDAFVRRGPALFMRSDVLLGAAVKSGLPVTLNGLRNPILNIGGTAVQLGTPAQPYDATVAQVNRLQTETGAPLRNFISWTNDPSVGLTHTLTAQAQPGELLALAVVYTMDTAFVPATAQGYTPPPALLLIKVAQADAGGRVRFTLPVDQLHFTSTDPGQLDLSQRVPRGAACQAVLLRVNPRLDPAGGPAYTVIPADQVKELP